MSIIERLSACAWTGTCVREREWKGREGTRTFFIFNHWQGFCPLRPDDGALRGVESFELHRKGTLPDLVVREFLEVGCEPYLFHRPDEPLGRIVLVPFDCVPVVGGELKDEEG